MSSFTNWQGYAKRVYGGFIDPMPSPNTLADYLRFKNGEKIGDEFEFPIALGLEHGATRDVSRTAFTLLGAKDSIVLPARLRGASINMQGVLPRPVIAALANGRESSHKSAIDAKVMNLAKGGELNREIDLHYGPGTGAAALSNIGVVSTNVGALDLDPGCNLDLTRASWAGGLWFLMVGSYVDVYQADGSTLRASECEVTAVNRANNRVTLFKSGSAVVPAATDIIVARDARTKSCVGVQAILENTGTLFGISAATYPQWSAISFAAGGAMTRAKIMQLAAQLGDNGLSEGGKLFVNSRTFADLAEEASTLQRFEGNTDKVKRQGASNLLYITPSGDFEVAIDRVMKQGIAMFVGKSEGESVGKRVGTTDLTFRTPGSREWYFQELENKAGAQLQMYSEQAPVLEKPCLCARISGISNNGDTLPSA